MSVRLGWGMGVDFVERSEVLRMGDSPSTSLCPRRNKSFFMLSSTAHAKCTGRQSRK